MIKAIKNYLQKKRNKKLLIACELERLKENYVYRFLLNNYEAQLRGSVDLPAWHYATEDMKQIKHTGQLNKAYDHAREILRRQIEQGGTAC